MKMAFIDAAPLIGTHKTADGYLVATVKAARTGIQDYLGSELGKPEKAIIKVYRDEAQVFDTASMSTYAHKPVTNDHPSEAVTADTWSSVAVGSIGDEVARDGDYIKVPLIVMDAKAIADIEGGKKELSAGYTCDIAFESGVTADGIAYDAVQRNIRINHVAIVQCGRAGSEARIGDSAIGWGGGPVNKEREVPMQKITVDGVSIETSEQGAQVIMKLQGQLKDAATAHQTELATKDAAIASKDAELAAKDAKIADLEGKILTGAALDQAVADRAAIIATASAIAPEVQTKGLSDADIKKAVVVAKLGDSMKDKPAAYIDARYDILAEDAQSQDNLRTALSGVTHSAPNQLGDATSAYHARLTRKTA